jgi:hypothetical protein
MIAGLLGLFVSGFFAGAACYINVVEHAARLGLEDRALLAEWKAAYRRGFALQAPLAFLGFALGILAWFQTRQPPFLVAGLLMLANWPWTLLVIMRVNKVLMATAAEDAGPSSRALMVKWNVLHAVRSALGCLAAAAFLYGLSIK